jgi:hypothetical protein
MDHDKEQSPAISDQPSLGRQAIEEHGRALTANSEAASYYRQAQQAVDSIHAVTALHLSVKADPAFELAIADLGAITETPAIPMSGRIMNWERHHIEVVRTAASGNFYRASDLLREHLASIGCDPLAVRIVADLRRRGGHRSGTGEIIGEYPTCHSGAWRLIP